MTVPFTIAGLYIKHLRILTELTELVKISNNRTFRMVQLDLVSDVPIVAKNQQSRADHGARIPVRRCSINVIL